MLLFGLEQPHVLDCDDCLVSERLKQCDLSLREGLSLGAAEAERANRDTFSHQWDAKYRTEAPASCIFASLGIFVRSTLHVRNMDCLPIENRSAGDCPGNQRERLDINRTVVGGEKEPLPIGLPNGSVVCLA